MPTARQGVRRNVRLDHPVPGTSPAAFTLVELLVVIGIIALLIAILLPALNRARAQANLLACSANQRSILQALSLHAGEHKGYMPVVGRVYTKATPDGLNDGSQTHYDYFVDPVDSKLHPMPLTAAVATLLKQKFRTDTWANMVNDCNQGLVGNMFLCPADQDHGHPASLIEEAGPWIKLGGPFPVTSFAFNEAALGFAEPTTAGGPAGSPPVGHSRQRGHVTGFKHPAELMLLTDARPRGGDTGVTPYQLYYDVDPDCTLADVYNCPWDGFVPGPGQPGPAGTTTGRGAGSGSLLDKSRHPGHRMNVGFADGHVENVEIEVGALSKISLDRDFR